MKAFQQTQLDFVAHIRDPEANPYPNDIADERLKIYRDLFFNNVEGFLNSGFPVLKSLYTEDSWQALVRRFFADHACRSPYFVDISKEFVEFLSNEYSPTDDDPAFMQALAHYEWIELDVSVRKTQQSSSPWDQQAQVSALAVSELASLVSYHFPVHQISPEFQPQATSEPVFIVVVRDDNDEVNFTLVNQVTAHFIQLIQQQGQISVASLIQTMIDAMPQLPAEQVDESLRQVVDDLLRKQILLPA